MVTDPWCGGKNLHLRVMVSGVWAISSLPLSGPVYLGHSKGTCPRQRKVSQILTSSFENYGFLRLLKDSELLLCFVKPYIPMPLIANTKYQL